MLDILRDDDLYGSFSELINVESFVKEYNREVTDVGVLKGLLEQACGYLL